MSKLNLTLQERPPWRLSYKIGNECFNFRGAIIPDVDVCGGRGPQENKYKSDFETQEEIVCPATPTVKCSRQKPKKRCTKQRCGFGDSPCGVPNICGIYYTRFRNLDPEECPIIVEGHATKDRFPSVTNFNCIRPLKTIPPPQLFSQDPKCAKPPPTQPLCFGGAIKPKHPFGFEAKNCCCANNECKSRRNLSCCSKRKRSRRKSYGYGSDQCTTNEENRAQEGVGVCGNINFQSKCLQTQYNQSTNNNSAQEGVGVCCNINFQSKCLQTEFNQSTNNNFTQVGPCAPALTYVGKKGTQTPRAPSLTYDDKMIQTTAEPSLTYDDKMIQTTAEPSNVCTQDQTQTQAPELMMTPTQTDPMTVAAVPPEPQNLPPDPKAKQQSMLGLTGIAQPPPLIEQRETQRNSSAPGTPRNSSAPGTPRNSSAPGTPRNNSASGTPHCQPGDKTFSGTKASVPHNLVLPPPPPQFRESNFQKRLSTKTEPSRDYPFMCEIRYLEPIPGSPCRRVITRKQPCRLLYANNPYPPHCGPTCPLITATPLHNPQCCRPDAFPPPPPKKTIEWQRRRQY